MVLLSLIGLLTLLWAKPELTKPGQIMPHDSKTSVDWRNCYGNVFWWIDCYLYTNVFSDLYFSFLSLLTVWLEGDVIKLYYYIMRLFFHRKDQRNVFSDISKSILRCLSRSSLILLPNTKKCYHMMCYVFICLPNCKSFPLNNYSGKDTAATLHVWSYSWSCYGGPFTRLFPQRRAMILRHHHHWTIIIILFSH